MYASALAKHARAALDHLAEVLAMRPYSGRAHLQSGVLLLNLRERAVGHLREALRLEPSTLVATHACRLLSQIGN